MKIREKVGAKAGPYVGALFSALIRQNNKVGLKKSPKGDRLMFRVKAGDVEIPCSDVWGDTPRFKSMTGALGVPAALLFKIEESDGIEAALLRFEKMAKEKALPVAVYVREDGGWGSAIKPSGANVYSCQFCGITSRDESNIPIHVTVPSTIKKNPKTGGTYETSEWKKFSIGLEILAGDRKGAILSKVMCYAINKDDNDNWEVDAETRMGGEFANFLTLHKVAVDNLEPDRDFDNPDNGLPELEKMLFKHVRPLSATVNAAGWVDKLERLPDGVVFAETKLDEGSDYAATNIAKLFSVIDKLCRVENKTTAWEKDGTLSSAGKTWFKANAIPYMKANDMPLNFKKLSNAQVSALIETLVV